MRWTMLYVHGDFPVAWAISKGVYEVMKGCQAVSAHPTKSMPLVPDLSGRLSLARPCTRIFSVDHVMPVPHR